MHTLLTGVPSPLGGGSDSLLTDTVRRGVRCRRLSACDSASRLRAGEPSGASRRCAQWILNRMRLHSGTALRSPLPLPVMPNTINSIILLCQMYSATLSGHLLSQRPHPDVQARVRYNTGRSASSHPRPPFFYFILFIYLFFYGNTVQATK